MKKLILIGLMIINCNYQNIVVDAGNDNKILESLYFITVNSNTNNYYNSEKTGGSVSLSGSSPPDIKKEDWYIPFGFSPTTYDKVDSECNTRNMRMVSNADLKELAVYLTWMVRNRRESSDKFYRFFYDGYPTYTIFVRDVYEYYVNFGFIMGYSPASFGQSTPSWGGDRAGIVLCRVVI